MNAVFDAQRELARNALFSLIVVAKIAEQVARDDFLYNADPSDIEALGKGLAEVHTFVGKLIGKG